ncbi:MAG: cache domain-containing protein, partial [Anaerolineales bacterium]
MMKEINPPRKDQDEINVQRAFWVSIIYTIVAASSVGLAIFLIIRNPVWQVYTMTVIAVFSLGFDLAAVIYIRRGQPALGLKILYWSGLFTLPLNALLFSGVSSFLAAIILVVGFVNVFYLFPKSWRRRYQFGPIVAAVAIFILDLVNPPFRVNMGNVSGNFGWIVLGFIVVAVLVLANRQLWTGGILRRQSSQGEITTGKASRSRSLAATLSLAFLGLSFAVLFIATFIQSISAFQVQRIAIANQQQIVAQEAANTVTNLIQEKFNALEAAVQLNDPASKSTEEQETILETILGFDRAIQMVVLLTPEGVPSATATRLAQSTSVNAGSQLDSETQAKLFAKTQAGERYISPVYVDNVTNEPFVVIATPDIDVFGDFQGILMAQVNLKFMWDLVDRLEIGNTGQAYVIDKQGNLIAFGDVTRVLAGESVSHLDEVAEFINDTGLTDKTLGEISRGIDGTMVTATYVPLGEPDWAVVTELPLSEAFQGIFQNLGTALFVLLASSVLAGLVGGLVAQRLAVPLVDLTNTAIQVAQGNLNLQAAVQGP